MKKLVVTCVAVAMAALCFLTPAPASAEIKVAADFDVTVNSKYVWRGILLTDDWVIQPSVNVGVGNFTFNVWGNYEPTDETDHEQQFTEVDFTLEYAFTFGNFTVPVGLIDYEFPNTDFDSTVELYTGVSYDWIVSPSITIYKDIKEAGGWYILGALGYSYELPSPGAGMGWTIDAGASIAWGSEDYNTFYFGVEDSALTDWSVSLSTSVSFMEGMFTVTPAVTYTALLDDDIADTTDDDTNFVFGVSFTASF